MPDTEQGMIDYFSNEAASNFDVEPVPPPRFC
jgi:hypothetical protein